MWSLGGITYLGSCLELEEGLGPGGNSDVIGVNGVAHEAV